MNLPDPTGLRDLARLLSPGDYNVADGIRLLRRITPATLLSENLLEGARADAVEDIARRIAQKGRDGSFSVDDCLAIVLEVLNETSPAGRED